MPARDPKHRARFLAATCLTFFVVGGLGRLAVEPRLTAWDQRILDLIAEWRTPWLTVVMQTLSAIGAGELAIPAGLVLAWLLYQRGERQAAACFVATTLSGWALNVTLKAGFQRPRPSLIPHLDGVGGYSYPSGHAMMAPLVFGFGAILLARGARTSAARIWWSIGAILTLGIAFSRLYLAVHYPSDVIAALLAGSGWAALGVAVYSPLDPEPRVAGEPR